jgi:hypothetical protein
MCPDDLKAWLSAFSLEADRGRRVALRRLVWPPVALLAVALLTGVAGAATAFDWPDWNGTAPEDISESPQSLAWQPDIAAAESSGQVVVAWSDQRSPSPDGQRNVYTVISDNNGDTWSVPEAISETAKESENPDAVIVGDQVFIAWSESWKTEIVPGFEDTVYEMYEAEIGSGTARRIPCSVITSTHRTRPRMAADTAKGKLHVVFSAEEIGEDPDIFYAARPLTTMSWPTATKIYTHVGAVGSVLPVLAVGPDGETLHVVWEEQHSAKVRAVLYMSGTVDDGGVDWSTPITLSTGITRSVYPNIAADSGRNLHVVWGEQTGTGLIPEQQLVRYRRYDAASGSWSAHVPIDPEPMQVNQLKPTDLQPSLALLEDDDVTVCVAWHGFPEGSPVQAEEVVVSCSQDGGQFWGDPENMSRSPLEDEVSIVPAITFDSLGQLHGVWQEREGTIDNYQVYYAHTQNNVYLPLVMRNA